MPCAICGGAENEHGVGKSHHVYTRVSGDLRVHEEKKTETQPMRPPSSLTKLITVLHEKKVIDDADVLRIVGFTEAPRE